MSDFCIAKTKGSAPWYRGSPCQRKAVKDGYCRIHHPDAAEKRKEEARKRSDESYKRFIRENDFKFKRPREYLDALQAIVRGEGDATRLARDVLERWGQLPASVDRSPEGQDAEERLDAQHESAVPHVDEADARNVSRNLSSNNSRKV